MSHRRSTLRRACAVALAVVVGPVAVAAVPLAAADAVAVPTSVDIPIADDGTALSFDDGRLLTSSYDGSTHTVRVDQVVVPLTGQVTLAPGSSAYASTVASWADRHSFATSAGTDVVGVASSGRVYVRRGGSTLLNVPVPGGSQWTVDISGPYVRVGTDVYDVRRGSVPVYRLPGTAQSFALYGSRLVWSEQEGQVRLVDLAASAVPTVIRAGTPGCACTQRVAINATTVAYGTPGGWLGLWDINARTLRPKALDLTGVERFRLGDGFLATTAPFGIAFHRLNDATSLSVPTPYLGATHVLDLAFDGHAFAYLRADGSVTVEQLPDAVDGERRPVVLAASTPQVFSPNGDGIADTWSPSFVVTQPLTSWRLDVVDPAAGTTVASFASAAGAAPTANVAATWAPPAGRRAGTYGWTLTAEGTDGPVRTTSGTAVTGQVTLRRANTQTTTVLAPLDVATSTASTRTPLAWTTSAFPAGVTAAAFDVEYRSVRIAKGKRVYGAPHRLGTRTAARSGSFAAPRGATTQFRARAVDSLGLVGAWSAWRASSTPLDDRAVALRYGKGWSFKRVAGRWAGTERVATTSGRTMSLTRSATSGFALVMRTGPTSGSVKVYVDGKLRRTVSLTGAAATRREVYSVSFGKLGKHTIKLVTVASGKKKNVALDAVLVRH